MNSNQSFRASRGESVIRSMLAFALLAGVAWAVIGGDGGFGF